MPAARIFLDRREATPPKGPVWEFKSPTRRFGSAGSPARGLAKHYPCGSHGPFHSEQGHSPQWDHEEFSLTPTERKRALIRIKNNKGCLYEMNASPKVKNSRPEDPRPDRPMFPEPNTLCSVIYSQQKNARREGWGGLPTRREYKPVYVRRYKNDPERGTCERLPEEQVQRAEAAKKAQLRAQMAAQVAPEKKWMGAPDCWDPEAVTRGDGEVGPIGRLEPAGWWVSREPPVLTAPHHYHRDQVNI